jgi:hypothetical protein
MACPIVEDKIFQIFHLKPARSYPLVLIRIAVACRDIFQHIQFPGLATGATKSCALDGLKSVVLGKVLNSMNLSRFQNALPAAQGSMPGETG